MLLEKLADPEVGNQTSEWLVNDQSTRTLALSSPVEAREWAWVHSIASLPPGCGDEIRVKELFVSSGLEVDCFRIRVTPPQSDSEIKG